MPLLGARRQGVWEGIIDLGWSGVSVWRGVRCGSIGGSRKGNSARGLPERTNVYVCMHAATYRNAYGMFLLIT